MKIAPNNKGFTYIEVLISLVIGMLCMHTLYFSLDTYTHIHHTNQQRIKAMALSDKVLVELENYSQDHPFPKEDDDLDFLSPYVQQFDGCISVVLIPIGELFASDYIGSRTLKVQHIEDAHIYAIKGGGVNREQLKDWITQGQLKYQVTQVSGQENVRKQDLQLVYMRFSQATQPGQSYYERIGILEATYE